MRFWDASALVPIVVNELGTERVRSWVQEGSAIGTWAWTRVEISDVSARTPSPGRHPVRRVRAEAVSVS